MSLPAAPLLLDTNVVILLCRGGAAGRELDRRYSLLARPLTPALCIVSVGEALALARRNGWGAAREAVLRTLLEKLVVVDVRAPAVLDAYADVYVQAHASGRPMGQNDMWIAAAAIATGSVLLTTDTDFAALPGTLLAREIVDVATLPRG